MKLKVFLQKHTLLSLIGLFLILRLINLTILPIFNDEATYIDWSYRQINFPGEFFHSVKHAKPPLFMWVVGIVRKIIADPLLAGRLVSSIAGMASAIGLYKIGSEIVSKKTGIYAFLLYSLLPIFVFYDRQALMESSVGSVGIWSFLFLIRFVKDNTYKNIITLAVILGIGYLIKTSAIVFLFAVIIVLIAELLINKDKVSSYIDKGLIFFLVYVAVLSPLLLNDTFWLTLKDNDRYIFTAGELFRLPASEWITNIKNFLTITLIYLNPAVLAAGYYGIKKLYPLKRRFTSYLSVYILMGIFFVVFIDRVTIVRHTMPFLPLFLILPAYTLYKFSEINSLKLNLLFLAVIPSVIITIILIISPTDYFNILNFSPQSQKTDYVTFWSSGYGFSEVKEFLDNEAKEGTLIVGVRLDAGIPENAVFTYFSPSKKVLSTYFDERIIPDLHSYECIKSPYPIYFISRDNNLAGLDKYLEEIKRVYKPEGQHYIGILKINENCQGKTLQI